MEDIENPLSLILCRTAILKNCFLCQTLRWLLLQLVESVFKLVKISFSAAIFKPRNGEWGNGVRRVWGRNAGNQVENMGNRGGNAANHRGDVGNVGNQGEDLGNRVRNAGNQVRNASELG